MLQKRGERIKAQQPAAQPAETVNKRPVLEMPDQEFRNRTFLNFPNGIPLKAIDIRKQA